MAPKVRKKDPVFAKIVHGYFPEQALKSMSRKRLEQCVVDLVIYSSTSKASGRKGFLDLYERLCVNKKERPQWWPSDHTMSQVLTPHGMQWMKVLRFLAYKCCEYFKTETPPGHSSTPKRRYHAVRRPTYEIADGSQPSRLVKRNVGTQYTPPLPNKGNSSAIELPETKQPPLTQDEFLGLSLLRRTSSAIVSDSTEISRKAQPIVKFISCNRIPISSELGVRLMKRDGHMCPDVTKMIYMQKRERYINKLPAPSSNSTYPISYKTQKSATAARTYNFPKRQMHQHPGDQNYQLARIFCKPVRVQLQRQDLLRIQRESCDIKKVISKIPKKSVVKRKSSLELKKDIFVILDRL